MPAWKEGELGPLLWDCLEEQENEQRSRQQDDEVVLGCLLSAVNLEGLPEMGYNTQRLTGLKKLRGGCHTLSRGLSKLLLWAEFIES